jgi:predicted ATPase
MKIKGIHINDFRQFKDIHLDLTYPKGHEKEGKPLDKVCFIGQSGTGKTTLLKEIIALLDSKRIILDKLPEQSKIQHKIEVTGNDQIEIIGKFKSKKDYDYDNFTIWGENFNDKLYEEYFKTLKTIYIYFPSEIQEFQDNIIGSPVDSISHSIFQDSEESKKNISDELSKLKEKRHYNFSVDDTHEIWKSILINARDYMVNELSYSQKISKALVKNADKTDEIIESFKTWQKDNPNPFKELAKVLDPIIKPFNLKVKEDPDFEKAEDLDFIKLETLDHSLVPYYIWSTGTKQIVLTAIPIHNLDTNKTIILIDEPERSLYPDIQQEIVNYYSSLAPSAQFFYATHSPIIASSFEPWEIVELKFNYDKGKVFQEKYYEGKRHVDNYFINPQYLRWDSILTKVFDLKEKGNEKRIEKLMELAALGKKIEKEKDKPRKTEFYKEYKKLAELLDWETE